MTAAPDHGSSRGAEDGAHRAAPTDAPSVVIVNDSAVARAVTGAIVEASREFRLIGSADGGVAGVTLICEQRPALVLLDIHMPDINGVEVTRRVMRRCPTRLLVCSATIRRNASFLFDALSAGALDFTHTPSLQARAGSRVGRDQLLAAGAELLHKMRLVMQLELPSTLRHQQRMARSRAGGTGQHPWRDMPGSPSWARGERGAPYDRHSGRPPAQMPAVVAIGCSTGGPATLARLFKALPGPLPAAVMVSQHIEADFSEGLARWLSQESGQAVTVAQDGEWPRRGRVYLAAGGRRNLTLTAEGKLRYEVAADAVYYPNIDRMLTTVATCLGRRACGVILTGLGNDGTAGLGVLAAAGGQVLVEDPDTAVIDGMPRSVLHHGLAVRGQSPEALALAVGRWARAQT